MKNITDFDPLAALKQLQQGFILLSENQRQLNENQQRLQQAMDLLCESQRRLIPILRLCGVNFNACIN